MKKLFGFCLAIALSIAFAASAYAGSPSAKFAATWTTKPGLESAVIITDTDVDKVVVDRNTVYTLTTIRLRRALQTMK